MKGLEKKLNDEFTSKGFFHIKTKKGETQNSEKMYINIVRNTLKNEGFGINKEASSQKAYDFKEVVKNGKTYRIECKKGDAYSLCFNDTIIDNNTIYVLISTRLKYVKVVNGEKLIEKCMNDCYINDDLDTEKFKEKIIKIIENEKENKKEIIN